MKRRESKRSDSISTDAKVVKAVTKSRNPYSSKRDFGSLLVVGGSDIYSGAPALAAMAALRTGLGLANIAVPRTIVDSVRSYSPNLIVHPLPSDIVSPDDLPTLMPLFNRANAIVLGPGIGQAPQTKQAVTSIMAKIRELDKPVLVDADALRALAENKSLLKDAVITPHAGEFKALSGQQPPLTWRERLPICKKFSTDYSCVLLLKGKDTVVTDGNRVRVNRSGNPAMATGGMGDVLSGIIGTFLAQASDPFLAAAAGAYIHGMAGDAVYRRKGFHIVASDLVETLPEVLRPYDRINAAKST